MPVACNFWGIFVCYFLILSTVACFHLQQVAWNKFSNIDVT
jgi:hypothetical protein